MCFGSSVPAINECPRWETLKYLAFCTKSLGSPLLLSGGCFSFGGIKMRPIFGIIMAISSTTFVKEIAGKVSVDILHFAPKNLRSLLLLSGGYFSFRE